MTIDLQEEDNRLTKCVACLEPIKPGAKICPLCRSSQTPHHWQLISLSLKWMGGFVTTISLIVGVITLSRYYLDWQERRNAVIEVV